MNWSPAFYTVGALVLAGVLAILCWPDGSPTADATPVGPGVPIPLAVMGDSGSHSYQDRVSFPEGGGERGGKFRAQTLQWIEVLARMRANQINPGPWVVWGRPGIIALAREMIGLDGGRAPKKEDYLYNFANSGAACKNLVGDKLGIRFRQAPRLVSLMDRDPQRWKQGVVVIAIGANDWDGLLDLQARDPLAPELRATMDYCAGQIGKAIDLIRASHPSTRVLVIGVGNEINDPSTFDKYHSAGEIINLGKARGAFNATLAKLVERDPSRIAFVDPDPWFVRRWGQRGANGEIAYKNFRVGNVLEVTHTAGDSPDHSEGQDLHSGLVWNAVWAQEILATLRDKFALPLTPISEEELVGFIAQTIKAPGS